jgi:hypothetical protein
LAVRIAVSLFLIFFLGVTVSTGIQSLYALKEPGKLEIPNMPPGNHTSMERKAGGDSRDYNFTNQITDKSSENALDSAIQKSQNGGLAIGESSTQSNDSSQSSTINNSPKTQSSQQTQPSLSK